MERASGLEELLPHGIVLRFEVADHGIQPRIISIQGYVHVAS